MAKEDVVFKGTKEGILIKLNDRRPYEVLVRGLIRRLKAAKQFFRGAIVTLDVGTLDLSGGRKAEVRELITSRFGLRLARILGEPAAGKSTELGETAAEVLTAGDGETEVAGLADTVLRSVASSVFQGPIAESQERQAQSKTLLIKRTLRSGQRARFNGNIVILGDVNPGAEVVARGDVLVLGRLRGMVHAGAAGNDSALIAAAKLQPTQLRISRHVSRPPDDDKTGAPPTTGPEVAVIRDGSVVIDSYLTYDERTGCASSSGIKGGNGIWVKS